jgi:hypothetical protein
MLRTTTARGRGSMDGTTMGDNQAGLQQVMVVLTASDAMTQLVRCSGVVEIIQPLW